ncbi:hypothetical protein NG726_27630 [Pseudomonas sp. MOB-449]|nr:hypothetical protein [Pseudomonas sp. MOB-449]
MAESLDENKKAGILIILSALVLMFATLLFSDGYHPQIGLLWSLMNEMTVYNGYPFGCETAPSWVSGTPSSYCEDSFHLAIYSKYLIVAWLAGALYGVALFLGIAKPVREYLPQNF